MQFWNYASRCFSFARAMGLSVLVVAVAAQAGAKKRETQPQASPVQQQRPVQAVRPVRPARTELPAVVRPNALGYRRALTTRPEGGSVRTPGGGTGTPRIAGGALHRNQGGRTYTYNGHTQSAFHAERYHWPRGTAYRRYAVGGRLPRRFWQTSYYITDYALYGLDPPPANFVWLRYGPDLLEIDTTSGEIAQIVYGFFDDAAEDAAASDTVRPEVGRLLAEAVRLANDGNGSGALDQVRRAEDFPDLTPSETRVITQTESFVNAKTHTDTALLGSPARAQFEAGKALYQASNCPAAEAQFAEGLALDPYNPVANLYYGVCLANDQNYGAAVGALRIAVQYGDGVPEGQMAADEIRQLAPVTSPRQGNDDGCAIPLAPPVPDGATASASDMRDARQRVAAYGRYSDRFGQCVQDLIAGFQAGGGIGPALLRKLQGPVIANQQERQAVRDQLDAADAAYAAQRH